MTRRPQSLLVPLALVLAAGCVPTIRVDVLQPATVNLGPARRLAILETTGRDGARADTVAELLRRVRGDRYFTITDRSQEGISVKIAGQVVTATGAQGQPLGPDEIGLRVDILKWGAERQELPAQHDDQGKETVRARMVYAGKVLLSVTAFNAEGKAFLSETEFTGEPAHGIVVHSDHEEEAIESALAEAVKKIASSITPRSVQKTIRMDGDDGGQKQLIEIARGGNLGQASTDLRAYLEKNPDNAPALYNMAVLLDAQGRYREALDLYIKAISLSTKEYYVEMKNECSRRLANEQAMKQ